MSIFEALLSHFEPISLKEADTVKLMNRVDSKFVFSVKLLPEILEQLQWGYRVLEIEGIRLQRYQTLYFDTSEYQMYIHHHNGKMKRYKVRSRKYLDTGQMFFEIKCKNNKARTIKNRLLQEGTQENITGKPSSLLSLHTSYSANTLVPALWVCFSRITLVNHVKTERITIDTGLHFKKEDKEVGYPGLIIAELKQDRTTVSAFRSVMHNNHISGMNMSKYCLGTISLNHEIKQNQFKEKLITINKLNHDTL